MLRIAGLVFSVSLCILGQDPPEVIAHPVCRGQANNRTISGRLNLVRFQIPPSLTLKKTADVDYVLYRISREVREPGGGRRTETLKITFGNAAGLPQLLAGGTVRKWMCSDKLEGRDISWNDGGRFRARYVQLPFGYADYGFVSMDSAMSFDRVLDGMCCSNDVPIR